MSPSRILVTGGAGYIGSHAAKALRSAGFEPVVLDNLSTGHRSLAKFGPFIEGKIEDQQLVSRVICEFQITGVLHFAANAYVRESLIAPAKYFRNNMVNSLLFLETAIASGVDKIVFSSSCSTYGIPVSLPVAEDAPTRPINPYGESKLCVERTLDWYGRINALRWVALRYFNASGADADVELGEFHDPEPHLIPRLIRAALDRTNPVDILGSRFPTPDGTAVRDYVHVTDLADAHVRALAHLTRGGASGIYNLGTGHGYSVREVVAAVERATKVAVPMRIAEANPGDPPVLVADSARARAELGWVAQHSALDEIVDSALRWEQSELRQALADLQLGQ